MQDCINTVSDFSNVREAVCISTRKIMDACRDQDCMEHVPVYLTVESQNILESAASVKARYAELLYAGVDVAPLGYQNGYFCVDIQYYYRVICDAVTCGVRPVTIYGLATARKQAMLYGGEGCARAFTSNGTSALQQPTGVVEAVDPVVLCAELVDLCQCARGPQPSCCPESLPQAVAAAFDDDLVFSGVERQLQVTLGQFSLVRLERETQLLIPSYDYCVPSKTCCEGACGCPENPCDAFSRMQFPVNAFFPTGEETGLCGESGCTCGGTGSGGNGRSTPGNGGSGGNGCGSGCNHAGGASSCETGALAVRQNGGGREERCTTHQSGGRR